MPITVCRPGLLQSFKHREAWNLIDRLNAVEASIDGLSYTDILLRTEQLFDHLRERLSHLSKADQRDVLEDQKAWVSGWIVDNKHPRDTFREEAGLELGHYEVRYRGALIGQLMLVSVQKPSFGQYIAFMAIARTASHPVGGGSCEEVKVARRIAATIRTVYPRDQSGAIGFCVWQASGSLATPEFLAKIEAGVQRAEKELERKIYGPGRRQSGGLAP